MNELGNYGMQDDTLWRIAAFVAASGILIFLVNGLLRRILGVRRKKWFTHSSNYVNGRHQQVDAYFRWGGAAVLIAAYLASYEDGPVLPLAALLIVGAFQELYTAYMEKKHSKNPNDYKFTLLQLPSSLAIIFICAYMAFPEFSEVFFYSYDLGAS
ncbi:DUF4181 domain-containing protein [Planococcus maitriensis]|uniref:DUF4181 domain-containing protein n=1 Tax=Planococcus maitriensis TaxID=221799 RepID=A0A365K335_9BACL|nr:DUF4181 domain-containing protein [Planococcus maitriensis]RAZ67036.1 hypothetical protein DP119_12090 [Planococcus maitriensis]